MKTLALSLLLGCTAPGTGGTSCTPGEAFCEGSKLWTCTRNGTDATGGQDCSRLGTSTNAASCFTDHCPAGEAACCRGALPTCAWSRSEPAVGSDATYGASSACRVSSTCTAEPYFQFDLHEPTAPCGPSGDRITQIIVLRSSVTAGQTITLPSAGITISLGGGWNPPCSQWTGTMVWRSDIPSWGFSIDAACSAGAGAGKRLIGDFSGNL